MNFLGLGLLETVYKHLLGEGADAKKGTLKSFDPPRSSGEEGPWEKMTAIYSEKS